MARRRSSESGGVFEGDLMDDGGDPGLAGVGGGGGGFVPPDDPRPGSLDPDMDNALRGIFGRDPSAAPGGSGIIGNTDTPRDLRPAMPNTMSPGQPSSPEPAPFNLPQGVSVNESQQGFGGDDTQDAPAMPMSPAPAAAMRPNPAFASKGSPQATRRVSAAPSALFGEEGSSTMFGRAGGLLGGGKGVLGGADDGEIEPTEMFKKLLEMYGQ